MSNETQNTKENHSTIITDLEKFIPGCGLETVTFVRRKLRNGNGKYKQETLDKWVAVSPTH